MNESTDTSRLLSNTTYDYQRKELNISYVICEIVVAILAVAGNALVIYVFKKERRLRRRTNYYIISLATADFLVGLLGIPFAIMSSVGWPNNLHACLFTVSLLVVLCTISIFCLVAVSVDRYWAILHPMGYSRNVRTKTAVVIISICWFAGSLVGFLPLMGWHQDRPSSVDCFFLTVMDYHYLVFLYFGTIITPALLLAAFYAHIYRVVLKQLRQIVVMNPSKASGGKKGKNLSSGGMIRMLGVQQRNEVKATQNLAIIVLFFMICWIPLYTINCIIAFNSDFHVNSTFMLSCIILSHLNSAGNPLLYAYHLRDFRAALKNFFCGLLGMEQQCLDQFQPRGSNFSRYKTQFSNSRKTKLEVPQKLLNCPQVGVIVKSSAMLASVPAGKLDGSIWNIAEDSGRDSAASSQDSLKELDCGRQDVMLMLRPATPYKQNLLKEVNNRAYADSSSLDDSEDTFIRDCMNCYKNTEETCLSNVMVKSQETSPKRVENYSNSSPQLSRGLFLVEGESRKQTKNHLCVNNSPKHVHKLSPYKIVSGLFRNKRKLNRSLSDSDSLKKLNGVSNDYFSVPM
ncbi:histamine H2 receptor [Anthonomus grandis grandis]|uniref:histamine H2 receptor n=1 Tax=Anthonomus grandis grandis TaxID=2921223 RepID=UPI002165113F|nr:histamine H2 receptor [Anthonomus grandis grandis]